MKEREIFYKIIGVAVGTFIVVASIHHDGSHVETKIVLGNGSDMMTLASLGNLRLVTQGSSYAYFGQVI